MNATNQAVCQLLNACKHVLKFESERIGSISAGLLRMAVAEVESLVLPYPARKPCGRERRNQPGGAGWENPTNLITWKECGTGAPVELLGCNGQIAVYECGDGSWRVWFQHGHATEEADVKKRNIPSREQAIDIANAWWKEWASKE